MTQDYKNSMLSNLAEVSMPFLKYTGLLLGVMGLVGDKPDLISVLNGGALYTIAEHYQRKTAMFEESELEKKCNDKP